MIDVEQFVYTAAAISGTKGYQIVAKSKGINEEIISQLENYFYPVDIIPERFKESRSMIFLEPDLVVYSRIKNIGIGNDGRDNTLYNHSFVVSRQSFKKYSFDSRIFDKFYLEDQRITGALPTLSIDPPPSLIPTIDFSLSAPTLHEILFSLFLNKKVALLFEDVGLPQTILFLLPLSMRLVSFSTCMIDPKRQPKYNLIMGNRIKKSGLEETFQIISKDDPSKSHNNTIFEESILYYTQLIMSEDYNELQEINTSFERLSSESNKNKLILLCNFSQFQKADDDKKSKYAENVLKVLKQFDVDTFSYYFEKIKKSVKEPIILQEESDSLFSPYSAFIQLCFVLPQKMMAGLFDTVVGSNQKDAKD